MDSGRWWAAVEQTRGAGDGREWKVSHVEPVGERDTARAEALRLAREYVPVYPWFPQGRQVLRLSEDSYLVIVPGRTSSFHFRVHVGELLTDD